MSFKPHFRSIEGVEETIDAVKFSKFELVSLVQPIYFDFKSNNDLFLLQVKTEMLSDIVEGQNLTIRGEPHEAAILCTKTSTFEMKEAETSNSLMLISGNLLPTNFENTLNNLSEDHIISQEVKEVFHSYFELKSCKPRLRKLWLLLEKCPYQGKEYEAELNEKYTMQDLQCYVQASVNELYSAIEEMHACEINGFVRLLDINYKLRVIAQILETADSESFDFRKVPKDYIIDLLQDLEPREVLDCCFQWYATETTEFDSSGRQLYHFIESEVCKTFAEVLLRHAEKFNYREFLDTWQKSVPVGMNAQIIHLEGLALIDLTARPEVISYFPAHSLSDNVNERFKKLFAMKSKWKEDEIMPYLKNMTSTKLEARSLLMKHTRASVQNGIKLFSSRY